MINLGCTTQKNTNKDYKSPYNFEALKVATRLFNIVSIEYNKRITLQQKRDAESIVKELIEEFKKDWAKIDHKLIPHIETQLYEAIPINVKGKSAYSGSQGEILAITAILVKECIDEHLSRFPIEDINVKMEDIYGVHTGYGKHKWF